MSAFLCAADAPATTTGTFNIGTGVQTTVAELHQLIAAAVGVSRPPDHAEARTGEIHRERIGPDPGRPGAGLETRHRPHSRHQAHRRLAARHPRSFARRTGPGLRAPHATQHHACAYCHGSSIRRRGLGELMAVGDSVRTSRDYAPSRSV